MLSLLLFAYELNWTWLNVGLPKNFYDIFAFLCDHTCFILSEWTLFLPSNQTFFLRFSLCPTSET